MSTHLDNHHRDTLKRIFEHPPSANIEWRQIVSLLEAVGTVREEHNGKLHVTVGAETEVFHPPHDKDIGEQTLVDVRRMLRNAGFAP